MIAKCYKCLAVAAASVCLLFGRVDVAQGAANDPGQPKWSHTTTSGPGGKVNGSPAISANGQTIYITSEDGYLHALVSSSGQEVAGRPRDLGNVASSGSGDDELICSPVVASDGTVYVASTDGNLYNINTDGSEHWHYRVRQAGAGTVGAVALAPDGTVYVTYDDDYMLRAIDPSSRKPKWEFNVSVCAGPSLIDSAPSVGPDGTIYFYAAGGGFSGADTYLIAVDCGGNFKWQAELYFPEDKDDFQYAPVVDANGIIYVPANPSALSANSPPSQLRAVNPIGGSTAWAYPPTATIGTVHSSPAIGFDGSNEILYFGSDDGHLYAVNSSGSLKWKYPPSGPALGQIRSSPALGSDNTVYFGCNDGAMRSIKDTTGGPVWQWTYQTSGSITSSPAIGPDPNNNSRWVVYFGSFDNNAGNNDNKVYAVYGSAPLATSATWPMFRRNPSHTASEATSTTCDSPYWITPHDGDSYSVSYCNCVLLKVHALAGTQITFYDLNSSPPQLNSGTAGSDNTYSFSWCDPTDGSHYLYFEASAGGHVISSECNLRQIDTSGTTTTFSCINVQFSANEYYGGVGPAAVQFSNPEQHVQDRWNVFSGASGASAVGTYQLFDVNQDCTEVQLVVMNGGNPTYTFSQPPANGANCGMLRGAITGSTFEQTWVELANVPSGTYDLYLYGTGGMVDMGFGPVPWGTRFELYHPTMDPQDTSFGVGWDINSWVEGNQYVVYRGIQMDEGDYIIVIVEPDENVSPYTPPVINGLQLVKTPY